MSVKINCLEVENTKRVKAVSMMPAESGLTIVGGRNNQGKTSVLDAIAWALGGDRFKPTTPQREGSVLPPSLRVTLSNGIIVERKGKNSALTVTDPQGHKGGQQLLNEFVEQLALDLPKFMAASDREKADTLLHIIGVGVQLKQLERTETDVYNRRHAIGQIADQKAKFAQEMTSYPDAPDDLVSAADLIRRQQDILARNGENQRLRAQRDELEAAATMIQQQLNALLQRQAQVLADLETAKKSADDLHDESTAALEQSILQVEQINIKVRANMDKAKAEDDAKEYGNQYVTLTAELEQARSDKRALLDGAALPLEGLSVEDEKLTYHGQTWDGMSGSDQLKVATAIVRKLNPNCGFVLMDKLEQMDLDTLQAFGDWLREEGLQAIATRVSTGAECQLIIEDGCVEIPQPREWTEGEL